jgi:hypothetical protein
LWETLARTTGDDLLAIKCNEERSDEAEEEGRCRMYNIKYIYYMIHRIYRGPYLGAGKKL